MYEFPFSWFVKCTVLVGRYPSDELVNCPEWADRFEPGDGTAAGKQFMTKTWDFLTRIQGGIWYGDVITKKVQLSAQWNALVDGEASPAMFEKYFDMSHDQNGHDASTSLLDLRRYVLLASIVMV
jgi:hypothetical protein